MEQAVNVIRNAKRCLVFTGAGMSKDSGIDTFRGGKGFWDGIFGKFALLYAGVPFGWHLTPGLVWSYFVSSFYAPIANAKPHDGYYALTRLREHSFNKPNHFNVVTMNVDGFHQDSGTPESNVFEIHGTVRKFCCIKCKLPIAIENPLEVAKNPPRCACGGYPRPDVTLFTESLPEESWAKANEAVNQLRKGDVVIVIGTSSVVYPAAYIPQFAHDRGATVIEVNPEEPEKSPLSSIVQVYVKGSALQILPELVDCVTGTNTGCDGSKRPTESDAETATAK